MARKAKGSWAGGKAPAQGGTKHKMSKPEGSKGGLKKAMSKGRSTAKKGALKVKGMKK